jgi:twitching motility two-component system response regulator PilH
MSNVLVIEDNKTLSHAYKLILQKEGFTVRVAYNGQEGLDLAKLSEPSLVLLDMLMPIMDGLQFLRKFKPADHPDTTIIILSNLNEDEQVKQALRLGASQYILKASTSPQELITHVRNAMLKNN